MLPPVSIGLFGVQADVYFVEQGSPTERQFSKAAAKVSTGLRYTYVYNFMMAELPYCKVLHACAGS